MQVRTRFSSPILTDPDAHPVSCTMVVGSLYRGVKQLWRGVNHKPPSSVEVKERVELCVWSSSRPSWLIPGWTFLKGKFTHVNSPWSHIGEWRCNYIDSLPRHWKEAIGQPCTADIVAKRIISCRCRDLNTGSFSMQSRLCTTISQHLHSKYTIIIIVIIIITIIIVKCPLSLRCHIFFPLLNFLLDPFIFHVTWFELLLALLLKIQIILWLPGSEDGGSTCLRKAGNYLPVDKT